MSYSKYYIKEPALPTLRCLPTMAYRMTLLPCCIALVLILCLPCALVGGPACLHRPGVDSVPAWWAPVPTCLCPTRAPACPVRASGQGPALPGAWALLEHNLKGYSNNGRLYETKVNRTFVLYYAPHESHDFQKFQSPKSSPLI